MPLWVSALLQPPPFRAETAAPLPPHRAVVAVVPRRLVPCLPGALGKCARESTRMFTSEFLDQRAAGSLILTFMTSSACTIF